MHENGNHDVTEARDHHDNPYIFFVTRGSEEVGTDSGVTTIRADDAVFMPAGIDHTHHYLPRTHVLTVRLGLAGRNPEDYHGGYPGLYFTGNVLETQPAATYNLRIREYTLAAGERRPDSTIVQPSFTFVIEGSLTLRLANGSATTTGSYNVCILPLNVNLFLGNEAQDPVKFVVVDLHS
jgi:quercetin dioxygenase-like cupin family protein